MDSKPLVEVPADSLDRVYADLDALLARENPRCEVSGRCCRFRESGHALFASRIEVERWAEGWDRSRHAWKGEADCPFFAGGRCENRTGRPLGCRVYFCDPRWAARQPAVYEEFHARIRRLHETSGVAYEYGPAIAALERVASGDGEVP